MTGGAQRTFVDRLRFTRHDELVRKVRALADGLAGDLERGLYDPRPGHDIFWPVRLRVPDPRPRNSSHYSFGPSRNDNDVLPPPSLDFHDVTIELYVRATGVPLRLLLERLIYEQLNVPTTP